MRTLRRLAVGFAGLLWSGASALGSEPFTIQTAVPGTAHQALFSIALAGNEGVAVGAHGEIQESADGGISWREAVPAPTDLALLAVAMNQRYAIAVGQEGVILLRGANGKWSVGNSGTQNRLFCVALGSGGSAVAVGAFGTVLTSGDGGLHWNSIAPQWATYTPQGEDPHLYGVQLSAGGVITLVGEFGLILRSVDAGHTWMLLHKGTASLFALDLQRSGLGYAVGQSGTILRTTDGGSTWAESDSNSSANLLSVSADGSGKAVVTAMHEVLVSNDGSAWRQVGGGDFESAWYSGVQLVRSESPPTAVLVGHAGRILRLQQ